MISMALGTLPQGRLSGAVEPDDSSGGNDIILTSAYIRVFFSNL